MREILQWRLQEKSESEPWAPVFERLVEEHQSMVFSIAWRMTGDRGLAEELAQDVLLELDRHLPKLGSAGHAKAWLRQVTMHRAADALRRKRAKAATLDSDLWVELEERHGLMEVDEGGSLSARIEELLAGLPEAQRAALVLRYQEDLTPEEIAAILRSPLATVKSQLQRGLKLLRVRAERGLREYVRGTR